MALLGGGCTGSEEVSPVPSADRYSGVLGQLRHAVLDAPATVDAATRRAAYRGELLPGPLGGYVDKLRRYAYRVEDCDFDRLREAGCSDDEIFEVTIAAALGAGDARLIAGLTALDEALA
jgi:hypothetical protein